MTKSIKHQFLFPHPPDTVWEYLTKPDQDGAMAHEE